MASPYTDTTQLSTNLATYYDKKLLTRLVPNLEMLKFGKKPMKVIPGHMGKSAIWTRYSNLTAATTALSTEGQPPSGTMLSSTNVSATVAAYGDFTYVTDFLKMTAIDNVIESASELFGEQAALTIDTLIMNELANGTAQRARGKAAVSDLAASDTLIASEIRKAVRTLENNKARPHNLTPGFYPLFVHPYTKYDLVGDTATGGWIDVRKYIESGKRDIEMNKIGDIYGVKAFMTQNLKTVSSTVQTYNNIILSEESFGITEIVNQFGTSNVEIIVKQPGEGGSADPLNQRGSVGWKVYFAPKVLDENRIIVLKTGATA